MNRLGRTGIVAAAACIALAHTPRAEAGLGRQLVRGVTYALSPSIGTPQNGPNFNDNNFASRFGYNPVTDGRSYEYERYFGDDSFGNPETLNLGLLNVQLRQPDGSPLRGAGIYNRVGYNRRLVPEVYWDTRTTGRNINSFVGSSSATSPVQYNIQTFLGPEIVNLNGQMLLNSSGSINGLGFYRVQLTASNTGTMQTSGVADNRTQDTSFDIGPVNLSGNIFADMAIAGLKGIGSQLGINTDLLPAGPAAKTRTPDEIARAIADGQTVTAPELQALLAAHMADPEGVPLPSDGTAAAANTAPGVLPVPEPGTLTLLIAGVFGLLSRSRRLNRRAAA